MTSTPRSEKLDWLADLGWTIGERNFWHRVGEAGAFMALAPNGRWCVVGDDLATLVSRAWGHQYPEPEQPRPAPQWRRFPRWFPWGFFRGAAGS